MAFRLVLTSPKGARGMREQYAKARDEALREAAEYWCRVLLPEHFKAGAEAKYRFQKRTEKHLRRKRREGRGEDPNVYTGRLAQKMKSTMPKVTVNRRGVVLVWSGLPRYTFVVDTMEFVASDRRWDDEAMAKTRAWMLAEASRAKNPEAARALVEKRIAAILQWRKDHPQDGKGRFKRVKRPDKVKEITAVNRADADVIGGVFRTAFLRGIEKA